MQLSRVSCCFFKVSLEDLILHLQTFRPRRRFVPQYHPHGSCHLCMSDQPIPRHSQMVQNLFWDATLQGIFTRLNVCLLLSWAHYTLCFFAQIFAFSALHTILLPRQVSKNNPKNPKTRTNKC